MDPFAFVRRSYDQLLDTREGYLDEALREIFPVQSESRRWEFVARGLVFDRVRYGERECAIRGLTLTSITKLTLQQIVYDDNDPPTIEDIREQELYSGESPLPTTAGTLIVNGTARVIRAELGPCVGFAPFERGWRYGNRWGDCLEFVAMKDGVTLTHRLAEDSVSAVWTGEPPVMIEKGKRSALKEPELPAKLALRTRDDLQDFLSKYPLPTKSRSVIAPRSLFSRGEDAPWSSEDFERVIDWVRTDEAEKLRRESVAPLRVLGPGLVLARWLRRGLFLTAMDARDRGDVISFGPRAKPKRRRDFSWMPHDAWSARPLATLIRARIESEAHTPVAPVASPTSVAALQRSLRVPSWIVLPEGWRSTTSKKLTLAELPLCELERDGEILRPDRFTARTLRGALRLTSDDRDVSPLPLASPDTLPTDEALSLAVARSALATRAFERSTNVLAITDDALGVSTDRGVQWIELSPEASQGKLHFRERFCCTPGAHEAGALYAETTTTRDGQLALGKLLRFGFDLRVSKDAVWISTARIGDAMDALCAEEVESVVRDTRLGREEWSDQAITDSLATVGATITAGQTLATLLIPTDDPSLSAETRLLRAIDGTPLGPALERPVRWSGPTATVVARTVIARRGVDDLPCILAQREARMRSLAARIEACERIEDESVRDALIELVREDEYNAGRGYDLPPGVIAMAQWLLAWREPLAKNAVLALRDGARLSVETVTNDRFFEGAEQVDALVHPSMRGRIEALAERVESLGAQSSSAPVLYALRLA